MGQLVHLSSFCYGLITARRFFYSALSLLELSRAVRLNRRPLLGACKIWSPMTQPTPQQARRRGSQGRNKLCLKLRDRIGRTLAAHHPEMQRERGLPPEQFVDR